MYSRVIISIFITSLFSERSSCCKPSVERETYVLSHRFKHVLKESLEFVWLKNSIPISTCRQNLACYDYNAGKTVTTLRLLDDGLFETNHTLKNITKADAGTMYLKYLGLASLKQSQPLFTCNLLVYDFSALTLQNCRNIVDEGSEVKCSCKKKDDVLDDFELRWFHDNGTVQNNGSNLLSFVATKDDFGYTCRGWRSDGVESMPMEYRPVLNTSYMIENKKDNKSGNNVIDFQETTFPFSVIMIILIIILVLVILMFVTVSLCLTKGRCYSKAGLNNFKDLKKDRKMKENLLISLNCVVIFNNGDIKPYSMWNTDTFVKTSSR